MNFLICFIVLPAMGIQDYENLSTEEKIIKAAQNVFVRKGYSGTKTRDIAEEAGINIASLHYYYRSKDKLFELVIGEALNRFSAGMDKILGSDSPLEEKVRSFVDNYITFFKQNPYIPMFIMSEALTNPDKMSDMLDRQKAIDKLKSQFNELVEAGAIRKMHHAHFMMNLIGLTAFPFVSKPILMKKTGVDEAEFDELLEERKEMIPDMIFSYLKNRE